MAIASRCRVALLMVAVLPSCAIDRRSEPKGARSQAAYAGEQLGAARIADLAHEAGVPCEKVVLATAVALGESEGFVAATHDNTDGSVDRGLWQINSLAWPNFDRDCVFEPACNARAMSEISQRGASFQHWLAYTNGRYAQFMDEAEAGYAGSACGGGSASAASDDPRTKPPESRSPGDGAADAPDERGGGCDALGYRGQCVGGLSMWAEKGRCRLRDCTQEGKTCGLISSTVGFGCREGTAGAKVSDCRELGAEGACFGDVLVRVADATCVAVDCRSKGGTCGRTAARSECLTVKDRR